MPPKSVHVVHAGRGCMPPGWSMLHMQAGGLFPRLEHVVHAGRGCKPPKSVHVVHAGRGLCCTYRQGMYAPRLEHVGQAGRGFMPPGWSMLYMQAGGVCPPSQCMLYMQAGGIFPQVGACCTCSCRQGAYAPRVVQDVQVVRQAVHGCVSSRAFSPESQVSLCAFLRHALENRCLARSTITSVIPVPVEDMFKFSNMSPGRDAGGRALLRGF